MAYHVAVESQLYHIKKRNLPNSAVWGYIEFIIDRYVSGYDSVTFF